MRLAALRAWLGKGVSVGLLAMILMVAATTAGAHEQMDAVDRDGAPTVSEAEAAKV